VGVLLGKGDGTFQPAVYYLSGGTTPITRDRDMMATAILIWW